MEFIVKRELRESNNDVDFLISEKTWMELKNQTSTGLICQSRTKLQA